MAGTMAIITPAAATTCSTAQENAIAGMHGNAITGWSANAIIMPVIAIGTMESGTGPTVRNGVIAIGIDAWTPIGVAKARA